MEQQKSMKEWYEIVKNPQNEDDDQFAFRISQGKFKNVIYKYHTFGVNQEPNDDGTLTYKFEYDILENNGIPKERFNDDFFKLIGDILYHIIVVQTPEPEETNESDNRENDIIKPSIQ